MDVVTADAPRTRNGIDVSQIPAVEVRNISSTFLDAVQRYYDDPKNLEAFDRWKKNRDAHNPKIKQ